MLKGSNLRDAILDALTETEVLSVAELCVRVGSKYGSVHHNLRLLRRGGVVDTTDRACRKGPHGYSVHGWFILHDEEED